MQTSSSSPRLTWLPSTCEAAAQKLPLMFAVHECGDDDDDDDHYDDDRHADSDDHMMMTMMMMIVIMLCCCHYCD